MKIFLTLTCKSYIEKIKMHSMILVIFSYKNNSEYRVGKGYKYKDMKSFEKLYWIKSRIVDILIFYATPRSSTSKISTEFGGMQPGTPLAPYPISYKNITFDSLSKVLNIEVKMKLY